jgi:hypothetical protein
MDWTIVAFLVGWFVLMYWVLPKLGIPTCLNGSCSVNRPKEGAMEGSIKEAGDDR